MFHDPNQDYKCTCQNPRYTQAGDMCFLTSEVNSVLRQYSANSRMVYSNINTGGKTGQSSIVSNSDSITYLYTKAAMNCNKGNIQECHVLANLCVLNLYDVESSPCRLLINIVKNSPENALANSFYAIDGYKAGMPWIFYLTQGGTPKPANQILEAEGRVKFHASFSYVN